MNNTAGKLSASLEDYLETIFQIIQDRQAARAKDISDSLHVGKSSVTGALHALADRKLINYAPYDVITMTDKGKTVAKDIIRRHTVLKDFFTQILGIDEAEADQAACKMEHAISENILERFMEFIAAQEKDNPKETRVTRSETVENSADNNAVTLASLKPGDKAAIVKIDGKGAIKRRLLDMGAVAGTLVEVLRVAPLGEPIAVKIKGYQLTLRKNEAETIRIKAI